MLIEQRAQSRLVVPDRATALGGACLLIHLFTESIDCALSVSLRAYLSISILGRNEARQYIPFIDNVITSHHDNIVTYTTDCDLRV
jgi:hypothetical protein